MASSSTKVSCFQCKDSNSPNFRNGWRLRNGQFAQICNRCACLYEEGKFCEVFHSKDEGWRDCESCGKLVHCGCIASFDAFMLLDFGGVICMECSKINFKMARKRCLLAETKTENKEPLGDLANVIQREPQYWPRGTSSELEQVVRKRNSTILPLFEKQLSDTDADQELGSLVIPKHCAEAYFPRITVDHGYPIVIQDTEGKEWKFQFVYRHSKGNKTYELAGLKEFMVSKKWQPGDVVTFYRIEPEKKLAMGLRKTHPC